MSMDYIRRTYGVPASRGIRVTVDGRPGLVVAAKGCYLRVRFDGERHTVNCHPTWRVVYPSGGSSDTEGS